MFDHAGRWLVFALIAVAMSYGMRGVAARARRSGLLRLRAARRALGLPEELPSREPASSPGE
jgi:hypothetical protein